MADIDWGQMFGIDPEDRDRWDKMNADAENRIKRGGGVDRVSKNSMGPAMSLAKQASRSRMQAAQTAKRDDARATRHTRRVVDEHTEFLGDEPDFG